MLLLWAAGNLSLLGQTSNLSGPVTPSSVVQEAPLSLESWLGSLDWSTTDTAWLLVAEAPLLSGCSLPKLNQLLEGAAGRPTAALLGGLRNSELSYWAERQYPGGHQLGALLADPEAWDSLNVRGRMILRPITNPGLTRSESCREPVLRWATTQKTLLDETGGPYSQLSTLTAHPTAGVMVLDPQYRRLRQVDPESGTVLRDLDLDVPYEAFYERFSWPDTNGRSLLGWLDSDAFEGRAFLHAEGYRAAWAGDELVLSFTRRYPTPFRDTTGAWRTTLMTQGFLVQLDSQWEVVRQALCHQSDLPEALSFGGQSLMPFGPDSGLISLHDFRKELRHIQNVGFYRHTQDGRVAVSQLLSLAIPDFLQGQLHGTRFAEPFLAGNSGQWVAGYRLFPHARIFPSDLPLQFPDTVTATLNRLVTTLDRLAERRIAWVIAAEAWDSAGRLVLVESRDSLPDRLLVFTADGTCLIQKELPEWYEDQLVYLQEGVLWGLKREGDSLWLLRTAYAIE